MQARGESTRVQTPLERADDQFRILVEGVVDYALYMLTPEGVVASWNAGAQRIKGYSEAEIIGKHFSRFYTDEDREADEPARALATAIAEGRYEKLGWRVRKDGTRFWANVVIDPIRAADGRLLGFAKITRDITERRDAEEAVAAAQRGMLQAQKMEAIAQLTYGVAHDFNNLLTIVTNCLDLIAVNAGEPQQVRRLAGSAQRAAERGAHLTQQLMSFSRQQALQPESHDLNTLIYRCEAMLRRACGEAFDIELNLANGLGKADVDVAAFESALLNLVINARDAMPEGGRICVSTRAQADDAAQGDYRVMVAVRDEGTGMPPEVVARATEPFFTTKEVGKGSGLGLSQVFGFVTQSGGTLDIDSVPGKGTTVSLSLPATVPDHAGDAESEPRKVLLVEDDADVQLVATEALRVMGYAVLTASDGPAALEILDRDPDIDLLFTDIAMPRNMTGIELAGLALARRPDLRILVASGYAANHASALPAGAVFLGKPYRYEQLQGALEQLFDR